MSWICFVCGLQFQILQTPHFNGRTRNVGWNAWNRQHISILIKSCSLIYQRIFSIIFKKEFKILKHNKHIPLYIGAYLNPSCSLFKLSLKWVPSTLSQSWLPFLPKTSFKLSLSLHARSSVCLKTMFPATVCAFMLNKQELSYITLLSLHQNILLQIVIP